MSYPGSTTASCFWAAALNNRLARLRRTALPTLLLAEKPNRGWSRPFGLVINTISGWANDFPRLTRSKSVDLVIRNLRFTYYAFTGQSRIAANPFTSKSNWSALPIGFLNVVVLGGCQSLSALSAAIF